jgi:AraC-like DNA-binding protein
LHRRLFCRRCRLRSAFGCAGLKPASHPGFAQIIYGKPVLPQHSAVHIARWQALSAQAHFHATSLAALSGVCLRQLERQFHEALDCTPQKWLGDQLVAEAERLLHSGKPIKAVSIELGFARPDNFTRAFKRLTGLTPTQFLADN